ncbi:hypothetical protein [Candidatus Thiosymbion oneisti]|uniref:hypothetical protein n=1 Tax=Candidatus Thiosymbion oneisti TaxID=589554 RepID=UPI0010604AC9|nr:hypothetical protein [Candidatus Thiosymbion oneisti]
MIQKQIGHNKAIWISLVKFITHVVVGVIAFFAISIIAVLLSWWVSYLESIGVNPIIVKAITGFEYLLLGLDLLLAGIFIIRSMYMLVKDLWK